MSKSKSKSTKENKTTTTSSAEDEHLVRAYIVDALLLQQKLLSWEFDRQFEKEGGVVIYSIDTDIFHLYVKPREIGADKVINEKGREYRRSGYTQIFRYDDQRFSWALAESVANAIFFRRSTISSEIFFQRHLVLTPPIDQEALSSLTSILNDEDNLFADAVSEFNNVKQEVAAKLGQFDNPDDKYLYVKSHLNSVYQYLFGPDSISTRTLKLKKLVEEASITSLASIDKSFINRFPADFIEEIKSSSKIEKTDEFRLVRQWILENRNTTLATEAALKTDADALARLVYINKRLKKYDIRIVHITGAGTLFEAGKKISISSNGKASKLDANDYGYKVQTDRDKTLTEMYLRHPASFLASDEVSIAPQGFAKKKNDIVDISNDSLVQMINVFIEKFQNESSENSIEIILRNAREKLDANPSLADEFIEDWKNLCAPLIATQAKTVYPNKDNIDRFFDDVGGYLEEKWDDFVESSAALGLMLSADSSTTVIARDVPLVLFDCNIDAEHAVQAVRASLDLEKTDKQKTYVSALNKLKDSGDSPYFYNVGMAILFAGKNQWRAASYFANRSIRQLGKNTGNCDANIVITGREAFFVSAVIHRILARNFHELYKCRDLLKEAERALSLDLELNPELSISQVRYDSERIALITSDYLLKTFGRHGALGTIEFDISKFEELYRIVSDKSKYGNDELNFFPILKHRAFINKLMLFILNGRYRQIVRRDRPTWKLLFQSVSDIIEKHPNQEFPFTYIHNAVTLTAYSILSFRELSKSEREKRLRQANELFSDERMLKNSATHYDRKRFSAFKDICKDKFDFG